MNQQIATVLARYGARLLALVGGANLALLLKSPHLATLVSEPAAIVDLAIGGGWLVHVLQSYADTGRAPDVPPVAAARPWQAFHRNEQGPPPVVSPLPPDVPAAPVLSTSG